MSKLAYFRGQSSRNTPLLAIIFVLIELSSMSAWADRLHFADGESISGTLVGITAGVVNWSSPNLGELAIEQHHIASIESLEHFDMKTSGRELTNCSLSVQSESQHLQCDQGDQTIASWTLVVELGNAFAERPILAQKGSVKIAAEDSNGNTNITKYNVDGRSEWRYIESRHTFALLYQEESAESTSTRNMWRTAYQYDQFFTEQWFAAGSAFYEEDKFKDIEQRSAVGLGLGYQFFETSYLNLSGKGTINYVDEQLTNGAERANSAFLWNLNLSWRLNDKGTEFFHRHALLQSLENGSDFEMNTFTGLKYPINGHFSSVFQVEYDYDNLPADSSVDKNDEKWSLGLDYSW
jgi:putative salt-induced outer membrane protein YdiY